MELKQFLIEPMLQNFVENNNLESTSKKISTTTGQKKPGDSSANIDSF